MTEEHERKLVAIEERERTALFELAKLGFRTTLHELPEYVEEDILTDTKAGWKSGTCFAVIFSIDGKRKQVSGISAVDALTQAAAWSKWQAGLKPDAANKFIPSGDQAPIAVPVIQRPAGDTAETAARRAEGERRVVSFASGTPELVDGHGTPIGEANHASQFSVADSEES